MSSISISVSFLAIQIEVGVGVAGREERRESEGTRERGARRGDRGTYDDIPIFGLFGLDSSRDVVLNFLIGRGW